MVSVKITAYTKNVERRLKRLEKNLKKGGKKSVGRVARWTRDQIKLSMPKQTGESAKSIIAITRFGSHDKPRAMVTQSHIPHPDKPQWNGMQFNLPLWMFTSQKAFSHPWKSGSISKMRRVPLLAKKKFRTDVELMLVTAIK